MNRFGRVLALVLCIAGTAATLAACSDARPAQTAEVFQHIDDNNK